MKNYYKLRTIADQSYCVFLNNVCINKTYIKYTVYIFRDNVKLLKGIVNVCHSD